MKQPEDHPGERAIHMDIRRKARRVDQTCKPSIKPGSGSQDQAANAGKKRGPDIARAARYTKKEGARKSAGTNKVSSLTNETTRRGG